MTDLQTSVTELPATPPPPAVRRSRWGIAAISLLALGFLFIVLASIRVPYLATSPGPSLEVQGIINVDEAESFDSTGELYLLTISRPGDSLTLLEWFEAWRDPAVDIVERERIIPPDTTDDERRRANLAAMEDSQQIAAAVALDRLGYDVAVVGDGALVEAVQPGGPVDGLLEQDDIIVAVNGAELQFVQELITEVRKNEVGDIVTVTVDRFGEDELREVEVTLGESDTDPGLPVIGVTVSNAGARFEFPFEVDINAGAIGGPSAGLMLSLGVYNRLTEVDITGGRRIAGTGTITADGVVGQIGGVKQKVIGAIGVGAEYLLVPEGDFGRAAEVAGDDIEVVAVGNIDDALAFLENLPTT